MQKTKPKKGGSGAQVLGCQGARSEPKVLIVHDRLLGRGGGERVAKVLHDTFPNAKLLCSAYDSSKTFDFDPGRIISLNTWNNDKKGFSTIIRNVVKTIVGFRKFEHDADVIITSGMWAGYTPKRNAKKKIAYCHAPSRDIYDLRQYLMRSSVPKPLRFPYACYCTVREYFDLKHVADTDVFLTNSRNTHIRIKRYYGRNSTVLTPVSADGFYNKPSKDYWLAVGRFEPIKRFDIVIDAFKKMPNEKLVIVGGGTYKTNQSLFDQIQYMPNVTIASGISDDELKKLYAECKGTFHMAQFEDFGLTTQESFKAGKAAIVPDDSEGFRDQVTASVSVSASAGVSVTELKDSGTQEFPIPIVSASASDGGVKEYLLGNVISEPYVENLIKAVQNWDKKKWDKKAKLIQKTVAKYTTEWFGEEIKRIVKDSLGLSTTHPAPCTQGNEDE